MTDKASDLTQIMQALERLEERFEARMQTVEKALGITPDAEKTTHETIPVPQDPVETVVVTVATEDTPIVEPVPVAEERPTIEHVPQAPQAEVPAAPAVVPPPVPEEPRQETNLEFQFGTVWARRIGIGFLVVGLAFLVGWSYQFIGPIFKIGAGLFVSALMVGGGEWISRRRPELRAYGGGLIGGGYALGYFVLYAMHHIASVKLVDDPVLALSLMLGLAGVCITHSVQKRVEEIALLGTVLALATISLSTVGMFSAAASALMVLALVVVAVRMEWYRLYALGAAGSFGVYFFFTSVQVATLGSGTTSGIMLSGAFLGAYWLIYSLAALFLDYADSATKRNTVLSVLALSAVAFVVPTLGQMATVLPDWRFVFLLGVAAAYALLSLTASRLNRTAVSRLCLLLCLQLATVAVPFKFNTDATSIVWLSEVGFLVLAGLWLKLPPFRWFGTALGAVTLAKLFAIDLDPVLTHNITLLGHAVDWRWVVGASAVVSYAVAAFAYRFPRFVEGQSELERSVGFFGYFIAVAGVAAFVPYMIASGNITVAFWTHEALVAIALALWLRDKTAHVVGAMLFALAGAYTLVHSNEVSTVVTSLVIGWSFVVSLVYRSLPHPSGESVGRSFHQGYLCGAVALMVAMTAIHGNVTVPATALKLAGEAAALVAAGFALKELSLQRLGAAAFVAVGYAALMSFLSWTWAAMLPVAAIIFAVHLLYRFVAPTERSAIVGFMDTPLSTPEEEHAYCRNGYFLFGSALLAALIGALEFGARLPLFWALQFGLTAAAGLALKDRLLRVTGLAGFAPVGFSLLATISVWTWSTTLPIVAIMYGLYAASSLMQPGLLPAANPDDPNLAAYEWPLLQRVFGLGASLLLAICFATLLDSRLLAGAWAGQGLALVAAGFLLRDKAQRLFGLALFGLVTAKLLFIDLSGAETLQRIISFIGAGVAFLLVSYGYTRIANWFDNDRQQPDQPTEQ